VSGVEALFAPNGGWVVKIIDLSAPADDNVIEEVKGFLTLMQANEFARRYVRDSLEHCRARGLTPAEIAAQWLAFGEDAVVVDGGEGGFQSATEIGKWAQFKAGAEDRNWRVLDPRKSDDEG
jgi:hypothetical protein